MKLSYRLRNLLSEKAVFGIIEFLYQRKNEKDVIMVYLPLVTSSISDYFGELFQNNLEPGRIPDECWNQPDANLLSELEKQKVLKLLSTGGGEETFANVKILDPAAIEKLYEQALMSKFFIHYGIFSLNAATGDVYCGDYTARFYRHQSFYRVFKRFLSCDSHELSYFAIYSEQERKSENAIRKNYKAEDLTIPANQIIKDIRARLHMKGELSKLFQPIGKAYLLLPGAEHQLQSPQ